jgi:hypothetical protein
MVIHNMYTYHSRLSPEGVAEASQMLLHHQSINVPTAGAQAFLMDYSQEERAITHHASPVRIGGC